MSDEIQQTTETPAAPETPPTFDQTLERVANEVFDKAPVHGADGKFQPKVVAQGAPPANEVPGKPQAAPPDPQPVVIEAPQSLPADVKAKWATLPPEVQTYWSNRESEVHKKFTTDGERLKNYEAYDAALADAREFIEQNRIPKPEYIRRLAAADQALRTNGPAALAEIARMYGINPAALNPGAQPDPNSALTRELNDLRSQVTSLKQSAEQAQLKAAQDRLDSWSKDKPHYAEVEPLMTKMYEPGMDLDDLYKMAVRAHPEVSAKIEAEAKAEADKKAAEEAKAKAAKDAKLAPLAKRPGSAPTAPLKGKSWEDTLSRVADEVYAR